jgi:hypothetical protein
MSSVRRPLIIGFAVGVCFASLLGIIATWEYQSQGIPIIFPPNAGHDRPAASNTWSYTSFTASGARFLNGLERLKKKNPSRSVELDLDIANVHLFFDSVDKSVHAFNAFKLDQPNITVIIDIYQKMIVGMQSNMNKIVQSKRTGFSRKQSINGFVDKVMNDFADSADSLESSMNGQTFEKALNETSKVKTVITVDKPLDAEIGVLRLVDSDQNEYSLTKASDIATHYNDDQLFNEFLIVLLLSLIGSYVLGLLGLPAFLGNLFIGGILGSNSYIKSVIPLDTLSRGFGTMFIMFAL